MLCFLPLPSPKFSKILEKGTQPMIPKLPPPADTAQSGGNLLPSSSSSVWPGPCWAADSSLTALGWGLGGGIPAIARSPSCQRNTARPPQNKTRPKVSSHLHCYRGGQSVLSQAQRARLWQCHLHLLAGCTPAGPVLNWLTGYHLLFLSSEAQRWLASSPSAPTHCPAPHLMIPGCSFWHQA